VVGLDDLLVGHRAVSEEGGIVDIGQWLIEHRAEMDRHYRPQGVDESSAEDNRGGEAASEEAPVDAAMIGCDTSGPPTPPSPECCNPLLNGGTMTSRANLLPIVSP
jgi:hypothetical protein